MCQENIYSFCSSFIAYPLCLLVCVFFFCRFMFADAFVDVQQPEVFDEIDLLNLCLCECSTKNQNHSFQVSKSHIIPAHKCFCLLPFSFLVSTQCLCAFDFVGCFCFCGYVMLFRTI